MSEGDRSGRENELISDTLRIQVSEMDDTITMGFNINKSKILKRSSQHHVKCETADGVKARFGCCADAALDTRVSVWF